MFRPLLAFLAIAVLAGCGSSSGPKGAEGSGVAATETREVPAFHGVELAGSNLVTIRVGGAQSVVVHADDNLIRRVTTRVDNGHLVIGTKGSFSTKSPMSVEVVVPSIDAVALSGSGLMNARGTAGRLDVSLTGSGNAELGALEAHDVHAVVAGSGVIVVQATHSLDASVPGSGVIAYLGDPEHVTTTVTGSGAIARA